MSQLILPPGGPLIISATGDLFKPGGRFHGKLFGPPRKNGSRRLKEEFNFPNAITNQGKNYILNTGFNSGTAIVSTSWYMGLIDGTGTPALAAADTLASHAGWTEFTGYSGNRPLWTQGSATAQNITNGTAVSFNITATDNLYGIFIASVDTGGSGSDILWTEAAFVSLVPVANGDLMKASYTLAC